MDQFETATIPVDGDLLGQTDIELEFVFHGSAGSTVRLDNVAFPNLLNGGFQTGDLSVWRARGSGDGSISVLVSEPSTVILVAFGLFSIVAYSWRRPL